MGRVKFKGPPERWAWDELLCLFASYPGLLDSNAKTAKSLRSRLEHLLDEEFRGSSPDLIAILALKIILICPELLEFKAREGFEWVADNVLRILQFHSVAYCLGVSETALAQKFRGSDKKRINSSFKVYVQEALRDLGRRGPPSALGEDILRAILIKQLEKELGFNLNEAKRYVAALEATYKLPRRDLDGKNIVANIGTSGKPRFVSISHPMSYREREQWEKEREKDKGKDRGEDTEKKVETFDISTYSLSERQMDRPFENIKKKGLKLVEERDKSGKLKIIVVPEKFLEITRRCREESQQKTKHHR